MRGEQILCFLFLISISGLDWLFLYPLPPPKRNPSNVKKRDCHEAANYDAGELKVLFLLPHVRLRRVQMYAGQLSIRTKKKK